MRGCLQACTAPQTRPKAHATDLQAGASMLRRCMNVCIEYYSSLLSGLSVGGYRAGCTVVD
jgi:hypothetical protein